MVILVFQVIVVLVSQDIVEFLVILVFLVIRGNQVFRVFLDILV